VGSGSGSVSDSPVNGSMILMEPWSASRKQSRPLHAPIRSSHLPAVSSAVSRQCSSKRKPRPLRGSWRLP
jgi:hypothetical protein